MNIDIYHRLGKNLSKTSQGFPATRSGIEIDILKKLFTPEEAEIYLSIFSALVPRQAKPQHKKLQRQLGMSQEELAGKMEKMASDGLLLRQKFDTKPDEPFYMALPFIIGLYEFSAKKMDKELAELCHEYIEQVAHWMNQIPTKQLRIVPVEKSIPQEKIVLPYDRIDSIMNNHYLIALAPCVCAVEKQAMGHTCKAPIERCVTFDWYAEHYIDTGLGREISEKELYDILHMGQDKGLILSVSNMKKSIGFCLCCDCCCTALRIINTDPCPAEQIQAPYQAKIDPDKCVQCGVCAASCNMHAIADDGNHVVHSHKCVGCGICVTQCPTNAIDMASTGRRPYLPEDAPDLFLRMHEEHVKNNSFDEGYIENKAHLSKVMIMKYLYRAATFMQEKMSPR